MNRLLVAGIGNIFMGDDGFGCEVAQRLSRCELPAGVDVVDFGIRGLDLSYALADGYEVAILVDTAQRGGTPGSVYVIEPDLSAETDEGTDSAVALIDPHAADPRQILRFIVSLGDRRPRVLLVACEPEYLGGESGHLGLSAAAILAVDHAVAEVRSLVDELLRRGPVKPTEQHHVSAQEGA